MIFSAFNTMNVIYTHKICSSAKFEGLLKKHGQDLSCTFTYFSIFDVYIMVFLSVSRKASVVDLKVRYEAHHSLTCKLGSGHVFVYILNA